MSSGIDETVIKEIDRRLPPGGKPQARREMCLYLWFKHRRDTHKITDQELENQLIEVLIEEKKNGTIEHAFSVPGLLFGIPDPATLLRSWLDNSFWHRIFQLDGLDRDPVDVEARKEQ